MYFKQLFDQKLAQYSYLVGCQTTSEALVIDPVRDIDQYYDLAAEENLSLIAAVDTHIHADYISGLREFAARGMHVYASDEGDTHWKYEWLKNSNYNYELVHDGDTFPVGNIRFDVLHTPGHTPESVSFLVTDSAAANEPMGIFSGDFVFVGDVGRPDLAETAAGEKGAIKPAAKKLYQSIQLFKKLPEYLQVWPAHGSGSACGKALGAVPLSTVGYEVRWNAAFNAADSEKGFIDYILEGQPEPPLYFGRMKKLNKEGAPVLGSMPKPKKVSIQEMIGAEAMIADTRDNGHFMNRHLPDSLLVSFDNNFSTTAGSYLNPDSNIYLIIDEQNLQQAVRDLVGVGLDHIKGYGTPEDMDKWEGKVAQVQAIDFSEVEERRADSDVQVLDVRKATEYRQGHIPGSINVAYTRLAAHLDALPEDKKLLVHCASGQRAGYASSLLAKEGFSIKWVNDKFEHWKKA